VLDAAFDMVSKDNTRDGDDNVDEREPPYIGNELHPFPETSVDRDRHFGVGNVEHNPTLHFCNLQKKL
jgi:hypothetical protein